MIVIFTDLDGTLLEHDSYSFKEAEAELKKLREKNVPLVFVTSKTKKEVEHWRKKIGNTHPFICENGAALFVPKNYFSFKINGAKKINGYNAVIYSPGIKKIKGALKKVCKKGFEVECLSEMPVSKAMRLTNLGEKMVCLAMEREFDECFVLEKGSEEELAREIKKMGFEYFKGDRFHHIAKGHSKGKAVKELLKLYKKEFGKIESIGIGDSQNDFAMLEAVDQGFLVKRKRKGYAKHSGFKKAGAAGPKGWAKVIRKILKKMVLPKKQKKVVKKANKTKKNN